jgi:hypothetical protein
MHSSSSRIHQLRYFTTKRYVAYLRALCRLCKSAPFCDVKAQWYIDDRPVHFCSLLKLAIFVKCCKQQLIEYLNYSSNCDLWRAMLIVILYSHRNCFSVIFISTSYIWYSYSVFSISLHRM